MTEDEEQEEEEKKHQRDRPMSVMKPAVRKIVGDAEEPVFNVEETAPPR